MLRAIVMMLAVVMRTFAGFRFMMVVVAFMMFGDRRFSLYGGIGNLLHVAPAVHVAIGGRLSQRRRSESRKYKEGGGDTFHGFALQKDYNDYYSERV
jgi:hypothetical protein